MISRLLRRVGWFYLLAFGVAVLALLAFARLADEVLETEMVRFDHAVLAWVQAHVSPEFSPWVVGLSWIGSVPAIALFGALFALVLLARAQRLDAATLVAVLTGGGALTFILKHVFRQARPTHFPSLGGETTYSFPSGHALMSVCFFGYLAYWVVAQAPREPWRWVVAAGCLGISGLIGLSRLYLAAHWPTDIVAGALVAVFWLACCLSGRRWMSTRQP
ncbi:MAG TPA: phosphatase PAP2 family protein [Pantanalinema sp.]